MKKEIEYTQTKTLRAKITASKPHFLQKVIATRKTNKDAFKRCFRNDITIFMPKLKPDFTRPCVMLHIKNGNGSILMRFKNPIELADTLRELANTITNDLWLDTWEQLSSISDKIYDNELILDDKFVDVEDFKAEINEKEEKLIEISAI